MTRQTRNIFVAAAVAALTLAPVQGAGPFLGADAAHARGNGNGGGNGGGNAGGNGGGRGEAGAAGQERAAEARGASGRGASAAAGGRQGQNAQSRDPVRGFFQALTGQQRRAEPTQQRRSAAAGQPRARAVAPMVVEASARPAPRPDVARRGALASELKGLNAAHASPVALANAAPDSQVGRIATYRDAALGSLSAGADVAAAEQAYAEALTALADYDATYDGPTLAEIEAELARLDPDSPDYDPDYVAGLDDPETERDRLEQERLAAQDFEAGREELANAVDLSEAELAAARDAAELAGLTEEEALLAASNGRVLSPEALAELRRLLELDSVQDEQQEAVIVVEAP